MARRRTTSAEDSLIVEEYLHGTSALKISEKIGKSLRLVLDRIREAGVPVRRTGRVPIRALQLSEEATRQFKALVDGLMLGDGSIQPDGVLRLGQCFRRADWPQEVGKTFDTFGLPCRTVTLKGRVSKPITSQGVKRTILNKGSVLLYTATCVELKAQRERWYPNGTKVVPIDVDLSPLSVAQWFAGDGTGGTNGTIAFCTNGFLPNDVDFLIERLRVSSGVESTRLNGTDGPLISVNRRNDAVRLVEYMGTHLPACCAYKVKHVRKAIPRGTHNRRLTNDQVREIRRRHTVETGIALATDFGVSGTTISNILRRKIYKDI